MTNSSVLLLSFAALLAASGQLLFKVGADGRQHLTEFVNIQILVGLLLYGLGTAIWIYALSSQKLVNVYAFTALTFVLVYAGGLVLLGEHMTYPAIGGVLLVLLGLYLITAHGA